MAFLLSTVYSIRRGPSAPPAPLLGFTFALILLLWPVLALIAAFFTSLERLGVAPHQPEKRVESCFGSLT